MNKMQIKIVGSDGTELIVVPFSTEHVVWAIRNSGFMGRITERVIAQYIGEIVWRAGNDWDRQMCDWMKQRAGELYQPGADMRVIDEAVRAEVEAFLSLEPRDGYDDEGNPIVTR